MHYIKINPDFRPELNFWELNPQVAYISPFNKLYETDNGGDDSSAHMWACFFISYPDEDKNFLFKLPPHEQKEAINRFYSDIRWDDPLFQDCVEEFPFACLNSIQRSLKEELESLKERSKTLRETPYTFDHYMTNDMGDMILDKSGKPIHIKGTAKDIDAARAKTSKIYEGVEKALEKFVQSKEEEARVYGGRQQTIHEKGLL